MHKTAIDFKMSNRRAVLRVRNFPVIDTLPVLRTERHARPSSTSRSSGEPVTPAVPRGRGTGVPPTDPAAFLGEIAPAVSTIVCSGEEIGFEFESNRGASTDPRGWGQIGTHRNGVFLRQP